MGESAEEPKKPQWNAASASNGQVVESEIGVIQSANLGGVFIRPPDFKDDVSIH